MALILLTIRQATKNGGKKFRYGQSFLNAWIVEIKLGKSWKLHYWAHDSAEDKKNSSAMEKQ